MDNLDEVIANNIKLSKELQKSINDMKGIKYLTVLLSVLACIMLIKLMGWI